MRGRWPTIPRGSGAWRAGREVLEVWKAGWWAPVARSAGPRAPRTCAGHRRPAPHAWDAAGIRGGRVRPDGVDRLRDDRSRGGRRARAVWRCRRKPPRRGGRGRRAGTPVTIGRPRRHRPHPEGRLGRALGGGVGTTRGHGGPSAGPGRHDTGRRRRTLRRNPGGVRLRRRRGVREAGRGRGRRRGAAGERGARVPGAGPGAGAGRGLGPPRARRRVRGCVAGAEWCALGPAAVRRGPCLTVGRCGAGARVVGRSYRRPTGGTRGLGPLPARRVGLPSLVRVAEGAGRRGGGVLSASVTGCPATRRVRTSGHPCAALLGLLPVEPAEGRPALRSRASSAPLAERLPVGVLAHSPARLDDLPPARLDGFPAPRLLGRLRTWPVLARRRRLGRSRRGRRAWRNRGAACFGAHAPPFPSCPGRSVVRGPSSESPAGKTAVRARIPARKGGIPARRRRGANSPACVRVTLRVVPGRTGTSPPGRGHLPGTSPYPAVILSGSLRS